MKCPYSNTRIDSTEIRAYDRVQCPCGSIGQAQWRRSGMAFKWHHPLADKKPRAVKGPWWHLVDGMWERSEEAV